MSIHFAKVFLLFFLIVTCQIDNLYNILYIIATICSRSSANNPHGIIRLIFYPLDLLHAMRSDAGSAGHSKRMISDSISQLFARSKGRRSNSKINHCRIACRFICLDRLRFIVWIPCYALTACYALALLLALIAR